MELSSSFNFGEIVNNFMFEGRFIKAVSHGFGHINDTFALYFERASGQTHRYILQRINHTVFKCPEKLMENIERVTLHLRKKIIESGGDPLRETLNIIPTKDGKSYYKSPEGNYWRAYMFIEGASTYQTVESIAHIYNAGIAFGNFQKRLSDHPANDLHITISDFHNTKKRYDAFLEAVDRDAAGRVKQVGDEIAFAKKRAADASILTALYEGGRLPLRVIHNDTKFNNVLIDDKTGKGICVIDMDTVMPGLSLYDFGDSIRSGTNPGGEDQRDIQKVHMDLDLYEAFTKGYMESAGEFLTPLEIECLPLSAKLMTFECGIRFLTDYLNGDLYFKIHRKDHNLDRCRAQFKMVSDMESKLKQMDAIVKKYRP